jgi:hypothetical protein
MDYRGTSSQERFVLDITKNKQNGHYVELGAFHSSEGSNTFYLEKDYNWQGVSFEISEERKSEFNSNRRNPCMGDALKFDYRAYFEMNHFPKQIDYLQIDIDQGYDSSMRPFDTHTSLHGLISIPLTEYRFTVITFEHDSNMYWRNTTIRDVQREILDSFGYTLVAREIHEDFWVDPTVVDQDHFRKFLRWHTL